MPGASIPDHVSLLPPPAVLTPQSLLAWRKEQGLSGTKLAHRLGYSKAYVSLVERGRLPITAGFRKRLVKEFGLLPPGRPRLWVCPSCGRPW